MKQKHWTLQRVGLIAIILIWLGFKIANEDTIPKEAAITIVAVAGIATLIFFAVTKKGIFAEK